MAERFLKKWNEAHLCDTCKAAKVTTLTTHSTTDFREVAPGVFKETQPRYGCKDHPVVPMVCFLNGTSSTLEEYNARYAATNSDSGAQVA
jgi:hypothetical protein